MFIDRTKLPSIPEEQATFDVDLDDILRANPIPIPVIDANQMQNKPDACIFFLDGRVAPGILCIACELLMVPEQVASYDFFGSNPLCCNCYARYKDDVREILNQI